VIAEVVWDRHALAGRERKILRGRMATVGKLKDEGELDLRGLLLRNSKGDCLERTLNLMDFSCMNEIQPGELCSSRIWSLVVVSGQGTKRNDFIFYSNGN